MNLSATGMYHDHSHILVSKFPTLRGISGSFGLMPRLVTWHQQNNTVIELVTISINGGRILTLKFIILSARTLLTFIPCSGLRC